MAPGKSVLKRFPDAHVHAITLPPEDGGYHVNLLSKLRLQQLHRKVIFAGSELAGISPLRLDAGTVTISRSRGNNEIVQFAK